LSPHHIFVDKIFTDFGASTKLESDDVVGTLGYGCKSGFCYSDTFTVTSWHAGMKSVYVAVLDDSDAGLMQLLGTEPCGEETGLEILMAVAPEDIQEFSRKAELLFQHFDPQPEINLELPDGIDGEVLKAGTFQPRGNGSWIARMGCVPYKLDIRQIRGDETKGIWKAVNHASGVLQFAIGEVEIAASREGLKYTKKTVGILRDRLTALIDEYVEKILKGIHAQTLSPWKTRLSYQVFQQLSLPILMMGDIEERGKVRVDVSSCPPEFRIRRKRWNDWEKVHQITIEESSRILVKDTLKLKGYTFRDHDYVVFPAARIGLDKVKVALETFLAEKGLTGISISNLSEEPWTAPHPSVVRLNIKHKVSSFAFKPTAWGGYGQPYSDHWLPETWVPTDEDVFIILSRFVCDETATGFYYQYVSDSKVCKAFGLDMPIIYGYKTTEKKPVKEDACSGIPYQTWSRKLYTTLCQDASIQRLIAQLSWAAHGEYSGRLEKRLPILQSELGPSHPLVRVLEKILQAKLILKKAKIDTLYLKQIRDRGDIDNSKEVRKEISAAKALYPLMGSLWSLTLGENEGILEYIKMVDRFTASTF